MMKKAIGLLTAFSLAIGSSAAVFADSGSDTKEKSSAAVSQYEDDSNADSEQQEAEDFALENEDPEYGKYLDSLEEDAVDFSTLSKEAGGGNAARSYGYTNNSLVHNSKFDNMDKVWGIDVSYFQYDIDWEKVKADGIDYAIIRVGYRGYGSSGQLVLDYKFESNIKGAIAAGLEVGVYFYTQAINTTEAVAEADFVLKYIAPYKLDLPVYFDIESVDSASGRLDSANLTKAQKTALCTAFCDRIIANGYEAGVYANKYWLTSMIDGAALGQKYSIWLAHYTTKTDYTGTYNTWQFTGSGKINGISTAVDIDVDYRDSNAVGEITNFKMTPTGTGMVTFSWDKASNATKYELYRYNPSTKAYSRITSTTSTQATISIADGDYGYCVRAVRIKDSTTTYSSYSDIIYVSNNKVSNLTAKTTSDSVTLSWGAAISATGYEIYATNSAASNAEYTYLTTVTNTSATIGGLSPMTYHSYKVLPFSGSGESKKTGTMSEAVTAVTTPKKISAPTHLASNATQVSLKWTAVSGVSGYEIATYDASSKTYKTVASVSSSKASAIVSGLSAGTSYRFAVRSFADVSGVRVYSDYSSYRTCGTSPSAPGGVYTTVTPSKITVSWNSVSGSNLVYQVYLKRNSSYVLVGSTDSTSLSFSNTGTMGNGPYVVKAISTVNGKTLNGNFSSASTPPQTTPATPTISLVKSANNSLTIRWTKSTGCSGYRIYKYDTATKSYKKVKTVYGDSYTSYTVTGLSSSTQYKLKVKAFTKSDTGITWGTSSAAFTAKTK